MSEPNWVPLSGTLTTEADFVPTPENGKWLHAEAGAMVWDDPILDADPVWHKIGTAGEPAFQNGWQKYPGGYPDPGFRKLPTGMVGLTGLMTNSGWPAAGTGTVAFYLPVGYRPPGYLHLATVCTDSSATIRIAPGDGGVQCGFQVPGWFSLDGVEFWGGMSDWVPILSAPSGLVVPTPVDGKWLKTEAGAMVWDDPIVDADSAWHDVTFLGSWRNYGGFPNVRYRKLSNGYLAFTGLMTYDGVWPIGTDNHIFTLPVGYRPPARNHRRTVAGDNIARVSIDADGKCWATFLGDGWFTFDGVRIPLF